MDWFNLNWWTFEILLDYIINFNSKINIKCITDYLL